MGLSFKQHILKNGLYIKYVLNFRQHWVEKSLSKQR